MTSFADFDTERILKEFRQTSFVIPAKAGIGLEIAVQRIANFKDWTPLGLRLRALFPPSRE